MRRTVDLEAKTCSCTKWQSFGIPCHHAIAAARATNKLTNMKAWYDHAVQPFYLAANYEAAYRDATVVLPVAETVEEDGVTLPAAKVRQAGRPRKKRMRSNGDVLGGGQPPPRKRAPYRCGICGSTEHTRGNCTA